MTLSLVAKILPQPIKKKITHTLMRSQPMFYYSRMALRVYYQWLFKSYSLNYRVDRTPLLTNISDYEHLFESSGTRFEQIIGRYAAEFNWFLGRVYNGAFVSIDPEAYYSVIRHYKPNLIIEIGSGHSTHFAKDAIKANNKGKIICIDPLPRRSLPCGVKHLRAKIEDVNVGFFSALKKNDILFIDSSHTTQEARYHCRRILPNLKKDVLVHHHDFAYPYRAYYRDDPVAFGEPDVLLEFYNRNQDLFEVLFSTSFVRFRNPALINRLIKSYRWNPLRIPGSLWVRKKR